MYMFSLFFRFLGLCFEALVAEEGTAAIGQIRPDLNKKIQVVRRLKGLWVN